MQQYICENNHISATNEAQLLFCHTCQEPVDPVCDELPFIGPKRIQRKRVKGWRKPPNTVNVGRPSKWGNPFSWGEFVKDGFPELDAKEIAVDLFKGWLTSNKMHQIRKELKEKNLMCWCKEDDPCHADVLLSIANEPIEDEIEELTKYLIS